MEDYIRTLIQCWNCNTGYDYGRHEVCPVCDRHWLDSGERPKDKPVRLSIFIDYEEQTLTPIYN